LLAFGEAVLDRVAAELNDRPRKRFGYAKPNELITDIEMSRIRRLLTSG
jgi:IS30 family transposase